MTRKDYQLLAKWAGRQRLPLRTVQSLSAELVLQNENFTSDRFLKDYRLALTNSLEDERRCVAAGWSLSPDGQVRQARELDSMVYPSWEVCCKMEEL